MEIKCSYCGTVIEGQFQPLLEIKSIEGGKVKGESVTVHNAMECSCYYIIFKNRPDLWRVHHKTEKNLNDKNN